MIADTDDWLAARASLLQALSVAGPPGRSWAVGKRIDSNNNVFIIQCSIRLVLRWFRNVRRELCVSALGSGWWDEDANQKSDPEYESRSQAAADWDQTPPMAVGRELPYSECTTVDHRVKSHFKQVLSTAPSNRKWENTKEKWAWSTREHLPSPSPITWT